MHISYSLIISFLVAIFSMYFKNQVYNDSPIVKNDLLTLVSQELSVGYSIGIFIHPDDHVPVNNVKYVKKALYHIGNVEVIAIFCI